MTARLFPLPPKLTDRQTAALTFLGDDGADARQVGVHLHNLRGCKWCQTFGECTYAEDTGRAVLTALRKKGLVTRRRTGIWQQTSAKARAPSSQGDLPADY